MLKLRYWLFEKIHYFNLDLLVLFSLFVFVSVLAFKSMILRFFFLLKFDWPTKINYFLLLIYANAIIWQWSISVDVQLNIGIFFVVVVVFAEDEWNPNVGRYLTYEWIVSIQTSIFLFRGVKSLTDCVNTQSNRQI